MNSLKTLRSNWSDVTLKALCAVSASGTVWTSRSGRASCPGLALNTLEPLLALQTLRTLCAYRADSTGFTLDSLETL